MRVQRVALAGVCGLLTAAVLFAGSQPLTVSPGERSKFAPIDDVCPTFGWGEVAGAESYELVVYRLGEESQEERPVLRRSFSGSVDGWTPALDECLERGGRYAWSVRAAGPGGVTDWSPPRLFRVAERLAEVEFEEALAIVRRYLLSTAQAVDAAEAQGANASDEVPVAPGSKSGPAARAPAAETKLSVDGNVEATSFSGDGSGLDAVDADLLEGLALAALVQKTELDSEAELEAQLADVANLLTDNDTVDADTLGGLAPAAFMLASRDDWVDEAGDTMSGDLDMGGHDITNVRQVASTGAGFDLTLSSDRDVVVSATAGDIRLDASSSTIRLNAPSEVTGTLEVSEDDSASSEVTDVLTLTHTGGGAGASGIGTGILLQAENANGEVEAAAQIAAVLSDATDGAEASALRFFTRSGGGALTEAATLDASGGLTVGDLACTDCVAISELDFDPATQTELDDHDADASAHHIKTVDTDTTCDGWPCDGTNFTNLDWDNLVDLPAGFDDDTDDDTTYTAGPGLVLSGVQFSLGTHHAAPMDNVRSTVDGTSLVGKYDSITIGADGLPVISYDGAGALKVAHCDDAACSGGGETVSTVDGAAGAGLHTSIAIGADGLPVISYRYLGGLRMVRCNDAACAGGDETPQTLHSVSPPPGRTSITVGSDGLPVISYYEQDNDDLNVIHCNDAACTGGDETLSTVDSGGDVGDYNSIAIGADGWPVISYYDASNSALKVAHCNDVACTGGGESLSTVDDTGTVGQYSSITIGVDGLPVISYRGAGLKVAHCNDPQCSGSDETLSTVDSDGNAGLDTSITIGADGLPVISYKNNVTGAVRLAHCNDLACSGGNESLVTVHQAGTGSQHTSITIGADGLPVISFENGGLKVVRCASAFCVPYFRRR